MKTINSDTTVTNDQQRIQLARAVRDACKEAARDAFEDAGVSGLCREGAIEAAIGAIEMVDLEQFATENEP